jgi:hypothetical protein
MDIEAQVARLDKNVDELERCVSSLEERLFLTPVTRWSPRDIVAHLVGWNRYLVKGASQIRRGQLPFYDIDPGENYSKVNAALIREYCSTNRGELLDELRASAQELRQFLHSLDAGEWDRDFGVRHHGVVTIRSSIDDLIEDYVHHRKQIGEWADREAGA